MNESYAEAGCSRRPIASTYLIQVGMIALTILAFYLASIIPGVMFIAILMIVGMVYVFPRLNIEYEYIFCDGQIDFDRISGGQKRKTMRRIDFEQVEICAPIKSHSLDSYNHSNIKVIDYSSRDPQRPKYAVILRDKGNLVKIVFEPNETMLSCIKSKAPRKIVFD